MAAAAAGPHRVPVALELLLLSASRAGAVDRAGEFADGLPVRLKSVLSRFDVGRHELAVRYREVEEEAGDAPPRRTGRDLQFELPQKLYRIPVDVLIELPARDPDDAVARATAVLAEVPAEAKADIQAFHIKDIRVRIDRERVRPVPGGRRAA